MAYAPHTRTLFFFVDMNVVLTQDVKHLGFAGDIVDVAVGYARNFLIPRGSAVVATPAEVKRAEKLRAERMARREEIVQRADEIAEQLKNTALRFAKKVSSGDKLFGGISEADIAQALANQAKVEIEKSHIHMTGHIKTLGEHTVDVHLYEGKHVPVTVVVEEEK